MSPPTHYTPEAILEHLAWVQRLARQLCADQALAEDISQEVVLAGFERPPRRTVSLRQWLGGVVRNRVRMARRGADRRGEYEARSARLDISPATSEIVARVGVQRFMVDAVLELREPYRRTVLLRYFEELEPREIAAREGTPVSTVKTRLARALDLLRERLAGEFGEGDGKGAPSWLQVVAPLVALETRRLGSATAHGGAASAAPTASISAFLVSTGAFVMSAKYLVLPSAACLLALGLGMYLKNEPVALELESAQPSQPAGAEVLESASAAPIENRREPEARQVAETVALAEAPTADPPPSSTTLSVRVRVLDLDGKPVPEVEVWRRARGMPGSTEGESVGHTDAEGVLEYHQVRDSVHLWVRDEAYVTLMEGAVLPIGEAVDPTIIVSRRRAVYGQVLDPHGEPLAEVAVRYMSTLNLTTRLEVTLDQVSRRKWVDTTDVMGRFEFLEVPEVSECVLEAERVGYAPTRVDLEPSGDVDVTVTLGKLDPDSGLIEGIVIDAGGQAVEGARVSLGMHSVLTEADGRFQLDGESHPDSLVLQAILVGFQPARHERLEGESFPAFVELRLGSPALRIAGRVVDGKGRAQVGVEVGFQSSEYFGLVSGDSQGSFMMLRPEDVMSGGRAQAVTDGNGHFDLGGLLQRSYSLVLSDKKDLRALRTDPVQAGKLNCEFVLPVVQERAQIGGRVIDDRGEPVVQASVMIQRTVSADKARGLEAVSVSSESLSTDADGLFLSEPFPCDGVRLFIHGGANYPMRRVPLSDFDDPEDVEIVLPRNASFFVDVSTAPERVGRMVVQDAEGDVVPLLQVAGQSVFTVEQGHFKEGRSPVYRVPVGQHSLLLFLGDQEVARLPLELEAGVTRRVDY